MKIANVIHEKELVNHTKADYINYINEPVEYWRLEELGLPTLYVGWSFMKACNPDNEIIQNADILKKRIIDNLLYWEFSFRESKPSHVKGVDKFASLAPQFFFAPKYDYINLDPVKYQVTDLQDFMDILPKDFIKAYNLKNEMLYLLKDDKITGIDLRMYEFFKFNISEMLDAIKAKTFSYIEDPDGETYQSYYKIFPNFELLKRYLVTF